MVYQHLLYLYALGVGIAIAGFAGSVWGMVAGDRPELDDILEGDYLTPIKLPLVVLHGPIITLTEGTRWLILNPPIGLLLLAAGLGWSFLQGVFVLTQVFGLK